MLRTIWLIILSGIISYVAYLSLQLNINNLQNSINQANLLIKKYNQQVIKANNKIKEKQKNLNDHLSGIKYFHKQIQQTKLNLSKMNNTLKEQKFHKFLVFLSKFYSNIENYHLTMKNLNTKLNKLVIETLQNSISSKKYILPVQNTKEKLHLKSTNIPNNIPKISPSTSNIKKFPTKTINKKLNNLRW